jgi:hypothetical protein
MVEQGIPVVERQLGKKREHGFANLSYIGSCLLRGEEWESSAFAT